MWAFEGYWVVEDFVAEEALEGFLYSFGAYEGFYSGAFGEEGEGEEGLLVVDEGVLLHACYYYKQVGFINKHSKYCINR